MPGQGNTCHRLYLLAVLHIDLFLPSLKSVTRSLNGTAQQPYIPREACHFPHCVNIQLDTQTWRPSTVPLSQVPGSFISPHTDGGAVDYQISHRSRLMLLVSILLPYIHSSIQRHWRTWLVGEILNWFCNTSGYAQFQW